MKFLRMCRVLCFLVMLAILVSAVAACGKPSGTAKEEISNTASGGEQSGSTEESNQAQAEDVPSYLKDTSPITLDWYMDEGWFTRVTWGQDLTSKYITEKTGVTVNLIIPVGDSNEKKNIMIATGDLPDILSMGWWWPHWKQMIEAEQLWAYNDLADKYDPSFYNVVRQSIFNWWKQPDGKTYVYGTHGLAPEDVTPDLKKIPTNVFSVRKDIYEAIGKPDMRTPEGFINALVKAKEMFPEINGQPIIPFHFGYEFGADGSRAIDSNLCSLLNLPDEKPDGTVNKYSRRTDPEMLTWIKAFRKAFEMKLITIDQFTDKSAQIDEKIKSGRVFATMYAYNTMAQINGTFYTADPNTIYIPIDGPSNSKLDQNKISIGSIPGWLVTMISKNTKNPERTFQFLHYVFSEEGQSDFYYGDPSMYDIVDGKKVMKKEIYDLRDTNEAEFCRVYGGRDAYCMANNDALFSKWRQDVKPWEQIAFDWLQGKMVPGNDAIEGIEPDPTSPAGIEFEKMKAKWGELLPKMLTAKTEEECERLFNEFKAYEESTSKVYLPEMQKIYLENKKKLGS